MSMAVALDTLAYAKKLRSAGCSEQLAVATKQDLRELEYRLTLRLGAMLTVAVATVATLAELL